MPNSKDDLLGEDTDEADEAFVRISEALLDHVVEFAEDEEIPDEVLPSLLMQLATTMRMSVYLNSVAQPSGSGFKRNLDAFQDEVDASIRAMKKDADRIIAEAKLSLATNETDEGETLA
jgi:hypothetical protein